MNKMQDREGIQVGDPILFKPLFGQSKEKRLMFTEVEISTSPLREAALPPQVWSFPDLTDAPSRIKLNFNSNFQSYVISSFDRPFRLNGNLCFKAILKKGDQVSFDGNKMIFPLNHNIQEIKEHPLSVGSRLNVLIEGETGTGKTLLAKKIHDQTGGIGRFIHLNLSAFSKGLIESELFGHKAGAFTGAIKDKTGAIELANLGTLFLDEIDSLCPEIQTKLLLFLDNGSFRRVGCHREQRVSTRFIFASGRKLSSMIDSGKMRTDFYFRISSGIKIDLKPLREDHSKIKISLENFERANDLVIEDSLKDFYMKFSWPGNYRQLSGHLEKKRELSASRRWVFDFIDEDLLSSFIIEGSDDGLVPLEVIQQQYVQKVFQDVDGDERKACEVLSITPYRLRKLLS